jgi:hypothetical protein
MKQVATICTVISAVVLVASPVLAQGITTAPAADTTQGNSDHVNVVGRLGIGYLGRRTMSIADPGSAIGAPTPVDAPVVGIRYWIDPMLGIDAGLGLSFSGGSTSGPGGPEVDKVGATVFILHAGVPLSLASSGHFSFQIVPEVNFGLASATAELDPAPDNEVSGFHLDLGARAGAEIHFGFIDIPQLSLQAGVGLSLLIESVSASNPGGAEPAEESEDSTSAFGTTLAGNPWDIFTGNISALYYF